jgi:hypothetical protein
MMKITPKLLIPVLLLSVQAFAASINATSCSQSAVASAISSASAGDTVVVPACSASWSGLNINKKITLKGQTSCTGAAATLACTTGTTISGSNPIDISVSGARVTGFTFAHGGTSAIDTSSNITDWRVDHCKFAPPSTSTRGVMAHGAGLVDHSLFINIGNGVSPEGNDNRDAVMVGDYNWSQPLAPGSPNSIYMEDNKFDYTVSDLDGAYDSYSGARLVFRFNYVSGVTIGSHGLDSTGSRSTLLEEIYNNTVSSNFWTFWNTRGGSFLIFNNNVSNFDVFADLRNYRSSDSFPYGNGNICNGTNYIDGNTAGQQGYPCRDQPGRGPETNPANDWPIKSSTAVYSESLAPGYMFKNIYKGATPSLANDVNISDARNNAMPNAASTYHIKPNRDFFFEVSGTGNGTSGIGSGPLANRPSTCSNATYPGPAYWATDQGNWNKSGSGGQGVLYVCTAQNTWTAYYTPYTYPHPLQGGTTADPAPAPPTTVKATAR